ncbi:MOSC domain-containing protein [Micromonospora sp. H61]|uniref:MOSC domain-containing protein n=1 Tax=Micromonospora sp. H61 TaxID=2824888 RepID=UPI001B371096|nr:MOSC N-terminal beta barrel domain-containing protein [Micromonospora sp. H61]MBQ0994674.1 MOSC domain-containing protein [Micromonospora sp. H61]
MISGRVVQLRRYPVKSLLGERTSAADISASGVAGDRVLALLDQTSGRVASAKQPHRWRGLLTLRATGGPTDPVRITLPDGRRLSSEDPDIDTALSAAVGRPVTLVDAVPPGATLLRSHPEAVLAAGLTDEVPADESRLGSLLPGTFFDFAPIHLVTTATLDRIAGHLPPGAGTVERYRPNLVLDTDTDAFAENGWVGRELRVGPDLVLAVLAPTPRCAVPTLAHGPLPRETEALRVPARLNRIEPLPGMGPQPCVGGYATVVRSGRVADGDHVSVGP